MNSSSLPMCSIQMNAGVPSDDRSYEIRESVVDRSLESTTHDLDWES